MTREASERVTREASERVSKEEAVITNIDQATVDNNIPPAVSKENINFNLQEQLPPKPPTIETCKASERDVVPTEDCNPMTLKPKPKAWLRFHPDKNDKNVECQDTATKKFKNLTNICAKYTPSASTFEPPSTEPPSTEPPSTDMLTLPSTEQPSTDMLTLP